MNHFDGKYNTNTISVEANICSANFAISIISNSLFWQWLWLWLWLGSLELSEAYNYTMHANPMVHLRVFVPIWDKMSIFIPSCVGCVEQNICHQLCQYVLECRCVWRCSLIFVYFKFYISIEFILFFGSNKIVAPAKSLYGDMLLPSLWLCL